MTPRRFARLMSAQVETLRREAVIDAATFSALAGRYQTSGWNWLSLGRWLLVFGAVSVAAGVLLLAREYIEFTLEQGAFALGAGIVASFYASRRLAGRGLIWSCRAVELLGGLQIIGLTFVLGIIYSSGSGNWPALLLIDLVVLLPLAYVLNNVLLLILCVVVFFTWFGGVTGYSSDWGAYWFGMNYPLRFLLAGCAIAGVGIAHRVSEEGALAPYRGFFKVWLSAGVFFGETALWLMSVFGNFGSIDGVYRESTAELWLFNLLWAAANAVLLYVGSLYGLRMLRGYAVTFLIIQAYTVFFWHVAGELGPVLSTFVAGGATLALVFHFERKRRNS